MRLATVIVLVGGMHLLAGCDDPPSSSDQRMNRQQEQLSSEAVAEVGMPAIRNFQEKRMMKTILELRDQSISTITYLIDLNAGLHKFCDSVGYGLPYATQYTSPQRPARSSETFEQGNVVVPQADPNGLFSPPSAEGTWVLCLDPASKKTRPVYVEPRVVVSPFPLTVAAPPAP